jgi:hypothetical protein
VVGFGDGMILYHAIFFFPESAQANFPKPGNDEKKTRTTGGTTMVTKEIPHCFSMSSKGDFS